MYGHYEFNFAKAIEIQLNRLKEGETMKAEDLMLKNEKYNTTIYVRDQNNERLKSRVEITCDDFETFSKIVKAVNPILQEEVKND